MEKVNQSHGVKLIAEERQKQIKKYRRNSLYDVANNSKGELIEATIALLTSDDYMDEEKSLLCPDPWREDLFMKMMNESYRERLIIAGALIAAELDRRQMLIMG